MVHTLTTEDIAFFIAQKALIGQYEHILSALNLAFVTSIEDKYGVDMAKANWELDLDKGELRRVSADQSG